MSRLRVIGGEAKGRRLERVPGRGTRPITDRVKEALFNILGPVVVGSSFLDLFAGTGSVGIEALSRGAAHSVLIDESAEAVQTIEKNLERTGLGDRATVLHVDAFAFLGTVPEWTFDFVYVAPPQYQGLWEEAVRKLEASPELLNPDGWVIAQLDPNEYEDLDLKRLSLFDQRTYGSTRLVFYEFTSE